MRSFFKVKAINQQSGQDLTSAIIPLLKKGQSIDLLEKGGNWDNLKGELMEITYLFDFSQAWVIWSWITMQNKSKISRWSLTLTIILILELLFNFV